MSILIVEDNPVSAKIIEFNLKKNGYETIYAKSGKDAIENLQSNIKIKLVITDILMPEMNGMELLNEIKKNPEWKNIPVIMCTSLSDIDTVKKAAKAGCRHYILKPINKTHLLQKVKEALVDEKPILKDRLRVMSELGLDSEAYEETLNDFTLQVNNAIELLEKHSEKDSIPGISKVLAHIFEGSSLVGAEGIKNVLYKSIDQLEASDGNVPTSEYPLILRELKVLSSYLSPPQPSDDKKSKAQDENAASTNDKKPDKDQADKDQTDKEVTEI
ncbi:MAG: response regulator [Thermodesulfobacteriota bacterium]|nr:response regulator [Thermodesulfobacteriota bacterium]